MTRGRTSSWTCPRLAGCSAPRLHGARLDPRPTTHGRSSSGTWSPINRVPSAHGRRGAHRALDLGLARERDLVPGVELTGTLDLGLVREGTWRPTNRVPSAHVGHGAHGGPRPMTRTRAGVTQSIGCAIATWHGARLDPTIPRAAGALRRDLAPGHQSMVRSPEQPRRFCPRGQWESRPREAHSAFARPTTRLRPPGPHPDTLNVTPVLARRPAPSTKRFT